MTQQAGPIEVRVLPTRPELAATVAAALVERIEAVQADGSVATVVLTGGTVSVEVHQAVAAAPGAVDWSRVEFWLGDERYVESSSADRNDQAARRDLLVPLGVPAEALHAAPTTESGLDVHAAAATWAREFPAGDFDLVILGMGPDGHTASLFPGRTDVLEPGDAIGVVDSPKPPSLRVSMTVDRLSRTPEVWFVAAGADKAEAAQHVLAPEGGTVDTVAVPAAAPLGRERTVWWLDRAAASFL